MPTKTARLHNVEEVNCGNCRFGMDDFQPNQVICRANPPTVLFVLGEGLKTQYPMTLRTQACRWHEPGARRSLGEEAIVVVAEPEGAPN